MSKKHLPLLLIATLGTALALSACGDNTPAPSPTVPASSTPSPTLPGLTSGSANPLGNGTATASTLP